MFIFETKKEKNGSGESLLFENWNKMLECSF